MKRRFDHLSFSMTDFPVPHLIFKRGKRSEGNFKRPFFFPFTFENKVVGLSLMTSHVYPFQVLAGIITFFGAWTLFRKRQGLEQALTCSFCASCATCASSDLFWLVHNSEKENMFSANSDLCVQSTLCGLCKFWLVRYMQDVWHVSSDLFITPKKEICFEKVLTVLTCAFRTSCVACTSSDLFWLVHNSKKENVFSKF